MSKQKAFKLASEKGFSLTASWCRSEKAGEALIEAPKGYNFCDITCHEAVLDTSGEIMTASEFWVSVVKEISELQLSKCCSSSWCADEEGNCEYWGGL